MKLDKCNLQFITHYNKKYSYIDSARTALKGGCRWIQLRMKDVEYSVLEETAIIVKKMCRDYEATFIIDDNVMLAQKIKADGVHLGKNDMPIAEARKILGEQFIIGSTINSFEDILHLMEGARPNYFGCGPYRYTTTKKNLAPILGNEGYVEIKKKMSYNNIQIPLIAIGGITKEDIPHLFKCGIDGIALSSSILNADNPTKEMEDITDIINASFYNHNLCFSEMNN